MVATDLAEALARAGTPFHQAHQIVGRLVLESVRSGKKPSDWTAEETAAFAPEFTADMARLLDPREGMKSREIPGGTGPQAVAAGARPKRARAWRRCMAMNKSYRQGQILKLIRVEEIHTQDELARELKTLGIAATQVTLSRDIRELRLVKTREGYQRDAAPKRAGPQFAMLAAEFLHDVRCAQNLVVLKTAPGHANSVAVALDNEEWPEVVGTIAGDDTILVIAPDSATANRCARSFWRC